MPPKPKKAVKPVKAVAPKIAAPGSPPLKVDPLKDVRDYYKNNGHVPTLLANESQARFGAKGDAKLYGDLGIQVARGQISQAEALKRIRNGEGVPELNRRAGDAVNVELDPQIAQLGRRATAEETMAQQLIDASAKDTAAYSGSVGTLYDKLSGYLAKNSAATQAGYGTAKTNTGAAYDALIGNTGKTFEGAIASTTDEAARLGLQAATPQATQGMVGDQAFLQSLFGGQKQSNLDLLTANALSDETFDRRFAGATASQGVGHQVRAQDDHLRNSTDIRNTSSRNALEYRGQAGDLESTRGAKLRENIAALTDARNQAQSEAEEKAFDREILLAKLELQREELGVDAEYKRGQLGVAQTNATTNQRNSEISAERVKLESRKTDAQLQKDLRSRTPGSLEYEETMAAIDLKKAQTKKTIHDYTKPPKADPVKHGKGRVGAESYLSSLGDDSLVKTGMHEVTLAMQYGKDYPGAVAFMRKNFSKFSELKDPNVQKALLNALDLAWEGPKTPRKK